jgi:hypothetical protein
MLIFGAVKTMDKGERGKGARFQHLPVPQSAAVDFNSNSTIYIMKAIEISSATHLLKMPTMGHFLLLLNLPGLPKPQAFIPLKRPLTTCPQSSQPTTSSPSPISPSNLTIWIWRLLTARKEMYHFKFSSF